MEQRDIKIMDVYDNQEFNEEYKTGFGFASVIQTGEEYLLFDTGGDSDTLLYNMDMAGIDPKAVNLVFLSHEHKDHTGGLMGFLEKNPDVKVYCPASFSDSMVGEIEAKGAEVVKVKDPLKIKTGFYSTGELGEDLAEHSLIINTEKGLVVMTGCAHPGIINILKTAEKQLGKKVLLAMGGFHHPPESIVKEFKELGVEKVAPSHCTGEPAVKAFQDGYGKDFVESGVGKILLLES